MAGPGQPGRKELPAEKRKDRRIVINVHKSMLIKLEERAAQDGSSPHLAARAILYDALGMKDELEPA